jgi:hypothetical protein
MIPKPITLQIAAPSRALPGGAVSQAFYVVENNKVTLTSRDGRVLHDPEGRECSRTSGETDDPHQVAALLLRNLRTKVRGDRVAGFDRPLVYPNEWGVPC